MLPAGLAIVCASPKALAAHKSARCARTYFDFADHVKANATGYFPYTPSLPMLYGLRESLNILFEERLNRVFEVIVCWLTACALPPRHGACSSAQKSPSWRGRFR
jgi:alanine-glyoxylate transaminase/serine-glyoxylate transaminase/serine-pyruvate transaminase